MSTNIGFVSVEYGADSTIMLVNMIAELNTPSK